MGLRQVIHQNTWHRVFKSLKRNQIIWKITIEFGVLSKLCFYKDLEFLNDLITAQLSVVEIGVIISTQCS